MAPRVSQKEEENSHGINLRAHALSVDYLTIRPVARKGYGSIAHEAKPNGLLIRGPWGRRV